MEDAGSCGTASGPAPPVPGKAPPVAITDPTTGAQVWVTKTAAKKIAKRALREQKKEATKPERRARERQRRKDRRRELREQCERDPDAYPLRARRPPPTPCNVRVAVDLGFDDLMTLDEATSLAAQLGYLYGINRTSSHPVAELVIAGAGAISGRSLGFAPPQGGAHTYPDAGSAQTSLYQDRVGHHMEEKNEGSWRRWHRVRLLEHGGIEALWAPDAPPRCNKEDVVYLTADTDRTIDALEEGKTYIIGGIVDRNRYKHLCAKKAEALGVATARLPIDPLFLAGQHMNARKVLTVNQVFAILVGWTETRDWSSALLRGLPTRKFVGAGAEGGGGEVAGDTEAHGGQGGTQGGADGVGDEATQEEGADDAETQNAGAEAAERMRTAETLAVGRG
ncbi:tRNA (guanine(9)-N(1))-methyltransferase [Malassezia sp. CBS 17886]|nr:tRNA (guanine(9)-N(1))-methyltransferase [Malassezia sp. CBS 17886]